MSDTTPETPKLSWWRRLSSGLKRTSSSLGTAVADLVTKRKLDRAMLDDIEDVLLPVAKPLAIDAAQKPFVILVVGVNGSGKTTTIGKLAAKLSAEGRKIMMAAGDTF